MSDKPFLTKVKEQYESYPYPPRDPADETRRLIHSLSGSLLAINHHCFAGRKDFRSGFRCLVAGGGTGDAVIFLAEQLRDFDAQVVYLNMSVASRQIAEARARVRRLENIIWVTGSIMELPRLGLGQFDYIECCGVLHHLESTEAGLQALNAVLKDDGAIFLMLYGKYGRQAVYDMQALLKAYLPAAISMQEKVRLTRQLLEKLPGSNSFKKEISSWNAELSEQGFGDVGLYDLLLHSQDRCFDVPGIYALARSAGLHLLDFAFRADLYNPDNHVSDPAVRQHLATLDLPHRQALAEQLAGNMRMHEFFLARQPGRGASLEDDRNALRIFGSLMLNAPQLVAEMARSPGSMLGYQDQFGAFQIPCTAIGSMIIAHADGLTSLGKLRQKIRQALPGTTADMINKELQRLFGLLHPRGLLYLVQEGSYGTRVPDYVKVFTRRP